MRSGRRSTEAKPTTARAIVRFAEAADRDLLESAGKLAYQMEPVVFSVDGMVLRAT